MADQPQWLIPLAGVVLLLLAWLVYRSRSRGDRMRQVLDEISYDRINGLLIPNGDEGEIQIEDALKRHENLQVTPPGKLFLKQNGLDAAWVTEEGGLRLRPDYFTDLGGMDGFYMAALTKT